MCDYSLHHVASRPAKVGEKLVTTQFNGSVTRRVTAVAEPNVAVCLLPGTEVAFDKEIKVEVFHFLRLDAWKDHWREGRPLMPGERRQIKRAPRRPRTP